MLYKRKSFTVPASSGDGSLCREKGHSAPDARGRCLNCGAMTDPELELVGGPFDGLRVRTSLVVPDGRSNTVTIGDVTAYYVLKGLHLVHDSMRVWHTERLEPHIDTVVYPLVTTRIPESEIPKD